MRFTSSLAIISLASLGLATPFETNNLASGTGVTNSAGNQVNAAGSARDLNLRDAEYKRRVSTDAGLHARNVVSRESEDNTYNGHGGEDNSHVKSKDKGKCHEAQHTPCLNEDDTDTLVKAYVRMISNWNDADAKYLAEDFVDRSDSINSLARIPLGSPTFPSKQAFIDHQHTQPDNLPLKVTHKSACSCSEIALIWQATFGPAQEQVRGLTILGATKHAGYWQIARVDVEFNGLAYLANVGGSYTLPGQ